MSFQMFKLDFKKGRGTRDQISSICWITEKAREFQKNVYCLIEYAKAFDCVEFSTTNWKILQEMGIPDPLTCLLRNLYAGQEAIVKTGHGTTDWVQTEKEVCRGCILSAWLLTYMQSTSYKMPCWMKHKLESRLSGEISITQICRLYHPYGRK